MAEDPYKYYRIEARELLEGLGRGALELEKPGAGKELLSGLLRIAHTLKGASRVVKLPAMGDLAHAVEDVLSPHRDGSSPVPKDRVNEVLRLVDAMTQRLASLEAPAPGGTRTTPAGPAEKPLTSVRVEVREMDGLLRRLHQATAQVLALQQDLGALDGSRRLSRGLDDRVRLRGEGTPDERVRTLAASLTDVLERTSRDMGDRLDQALRSLVEAQAEADEIRLLPAEAVFGPVERAVREAAQTLRKRVEFKASGHANRVDAHVLTAIREALLHLATNAVAHGIESEPERTAAGKPAAGRVDLCVERRGGRILFGLRDDGRGIDAKSVRQAAVRAGMISAPEAEALGLEETLKLLMKGGISTTRTVTEVSGRGVGLDAVRATVARLQGNLVVRTDRGAGTTFEISVPISLASAPSLRVEAGGTLASVPLDCVLGALRFPSAELARESDLESILWEGRPIPFVPLSNLLGRPDASGASRPMWTAAVVSSGRAVAAIGVDRILGTGPVVLRTLPDWLGADPMIAGAAFEPDGTPHLVLDPAALVTAAARASGRRQEPSPPRPPVLVVDDSLTTRMLEQSILESAGYEVELAVSGEEGLSKARTRKFGVFIVDVEMPGMDGFEFVRRTRLDPEFRAVPAILVTSRSSQDDRRRGAEAGASAYVVKSEFDQERLLKLIRSLIG